MTRKYQVLYSEGPGDLIASYTTWKRGEEFLGETSITFSSQLFEFCRRARLNLYAVSRNARAASLTDGPWTIAHMPRREIRIPKIGYELTLFLYALRLTLLALRIRPRVILINSGQVDPIYLPLLRLSGAKIVPDLHTTVWPEGFRPRPGLRQRLYGFVWRRFIWKTLSISPACTRQVRALAGNVPVVEFRPSFPPTVFAQPPAPRDLKTQPFRVIYAGPIAADKGVFDLLEMARQLPRVQFSICGDGPALPELRHQIQARALNNVTAHGKLDRPELLQRYLEANAVIVPTRSTFKEGFSMPVSEAVLLLRPVITSSVVPAAETVPGAVRLVPTDNVDEYVRAIQELSSDSAVYWRFVENQRALRTAVLDDSMSFQKALKAIN